MFTTIDRVNRLTGFDVTLEQIQMAQGMIEAYVGKAEADVVQPSDFDMLALATAYQAAYLQHNPALAFEQMPVVQTSIAGTAMTFRNQASPYIAGMAQLACSRLSWLKTRGVRTGPIFDRASNGRNWWTD